MRLPSEHEYGNGVAIFTRDGDTARNFASRVEVGMVGVNFAIPVPLSYYTFGGWKRSGFGDLNQHGPDLDPLLHQDQDRHGALAFGYKGGCGVQYPHHEVTSFRHSRYSRPERKSARCLNTSFIALPSPGIRTALR